MKLFLNAMIKYNVVVYSGLGLFFVLAGQQSFANALGLSIAFLLNLLMSPLIIFGVSRFMDEDIKFLSYLIIFSSVAAVISMLMQLFFPVWIEGIELYLPLIAISGVLQYRSELIQPNTRLLDILLENIGTAFGFILFILPLSILSEWLGTGGLHLPALIDSTQVLFAFTILPSDVRLGIFTGPYGSIGSLILVGLVLALIKYGQIVRGKRQ